MGRLPNHRLCPAFLSLRAPWLGLETIPIVARHRESMSFSTKQSGGKVIISRDNISKVGSSWAKQIARFKERVG